MRIAFPRSKVIEHHLVGPCNFRRDQRPKHLEPAISRLGRDKLNPAKMLQRANFGSANLGQYTCGTPLLFGHGQILSRPRLDHTGPIPSRCFGAGSIFLNFVFREVWCIFLLGAWQARPRGFAKESGRYETALFPSEQ